MVKSMKAAQKGLRKIVAAGRGRVVQSPNIRAEILKLARIPKPHVVYIGTASYDKSSAFDLQAKGFLDVGCTVEELKLTLFKGTTAEKRVAKTSIEGADVIVVSGGNTLFAMKKWKTLGVDKLLKAAMANGTVLSGGSAGAICWFDGGHSDSRDPTSVLHPKEDLTEEEKKNWEYIRVSGLGLVSGLCCPHHDSTQSNGVPRYEDFNGMLRRSWRRTPTNGSRTNTEIVGEIGICIDDQAAIVIDGDEFKVMAVNGQNAKVTKKKLKKDGSIDETDFLPSVGMTPLSELIFA